MLALSHFPDKRNVPVSTHAPDEQTGNLLLNIVDDKLLETITINLLGRK